MDGVGRQSELVAEARRIVEKIEQPILKPSVESMGEKIRWQYACTYQNLSDPIKSASASIGILRLASVVDALAYQSLRREDAGEQEWKHARRIVSDLEAGNIDGLASEYYHNLYGNGFGTHQPLHMFREIGDVFFNQIKHGALALVWFCEAESLMEANNLVGALDKLADAFFALVPENDETKRSIFGRSAVRAKLAADPRQIAKKFVMDCWFTWQEEPERYASKAAFARDMLKQEQCKSLTSQAKIAEWCRAWEKSHLTG